MSILNVWYFWKGYLVITISGPGKERFINLAVSRGLRFWDLMRTKDSAQLKIMVKDFKSLRSLVRIAGCRVRIVQKAGFPFWAVRSRRRKGLIAGGLLFIVVLYVFSSFIWFIDVVGVERLSGEEVLELGEELGIQQGMWKRGVDWHQLENEMVMEHEEIAWVAFDVRGTLLQIEVVESILEPEADDRPTDLVASKDGLVEDILVISGEPAVEPGDVVQRGQVLIKGELKPEKEDLFAEEEEIPVLDVQARGSVEARVWYEERVEIPLKQTLKEPTGNMRRAYYLSWPGNDFLIWGAREKPFTNYTKNVLKTSWQWRNLRLPVELITVEYTELKVKQQELSPGDAFEFAREKALQEAKEKIPAEGEILDYEVEEIEPREKGYVAVRVLADVREDIAKPRVRPSTRELDSEESENEEMDSE